MIDHYSILVFGGAIFVYSGPLIDIEPRPWYSLSRRSTAPLPSAPWSAARGARIYRPTRLLVFRPTQGVIDMTAVPGDDRKDRTDLQALYYSPQAGVEGGRPPRVESRRRPRQ